MKIIKILLLLTYIISSVLIFSNIIDIFYQRQSNNYILSIGTFILSFLLVFISTIFFIQSNSNKIEIAKYRTFSLVILYVIYTVMIYYVNFGVHFRNIGLVSINELFDPDYLKVNLNFLPFASILRDLNKFMYISILFAYVINFALFVPLGLLLPISNKKFYKITSYLIIVAVVGFSIEILQLLTVSGVFDIDDIILYLVGASLSILFFRYGPVRQKITVWFKLN